MLVLIVYNGREKCQFGLGRKIKFIFSLKFHNLAVICDLDIVICLIEKKQAKGSRDSQAQTGLQNSKKVVREPGTKYIN